MSQHWKDNFSNSTPGDQGLHEDMRSIVRAFDDICLDINNDYYD